MSQKWIDPKSDLGSFSLNVQNDDPDLASFTPGSIVRFAYQGAPAFQGIVERRERRTIDEGEEKEQYTTISGAGIAALLDRIQVFPENAPGSVPWSDTRYFNFANPNFDDSSWSTSVTLAHNPGLSFSYPYRPLDWPAASVANFIWSRDYDGNNDMPVGSSYFRATVTISGSDDVLCAFHIAVDNQYELWIDGVLLDVYDGASVLGGWAVTHRKDIMLSPGTHLVAVKATNMPGVLGSNPAALFFDVFSVDPGTGELLASLRVSDGNWLCLDYPAEPPGFSAGEIVGLLLEEAEDRGCPIPATTFTSDIDSGGNTWTTTPDVSIRVQSSLLSVLRQLSDQYIDWRMSPTGYELNEWEKGGLLIDTGFTLTPGIDLRRLKHTGLA